MSLAERLIGLQEVEEATRQRETRPQGWEPGVKWEGDHGEITTDPMFDPPQDWSDLLRARGLDPEIYEIDGDSVKWCSWDGWYRETEGQAFSKICYSFRARIRLRTNKQLVDLEDLYKQARKAKEPKREKGTGECSLVIALSDWQCGNGDVPAEEQLRILASLPEIIADHLSSARKRFPIGQVAIVGMGDIVEGCQGFYNYQPFTVHFDRREQTRVSRRAVLDIVTTVAKHNIPMLVSAVPGNHGENRQGNKKFTNAGDNDDVAIFEQVGEILAANPEAFGHVDVRVPRNQMAISLQLSGQIVGFTHGHIVRPSGGPVNGVWSWWEKQAFGGHFRGVGDATILVTGHFHHLNVKSQKDRTLLICPPLLEVGSYYGDENGVRAIGGTLSFICTPTGWTGLEVLS